MQIFLQLSFSNLQTILNYLSSFNHNNTLIKLNNNQQITLWPNLNTLLLDSKISSLNSHFKQVHINNNKLLLFSNSSMLLKDLYHNLDTLLKECLSILLNKECLDILLKEWATLWHNNLNKTSEEQKRSFLFSHRGIDKCILQFFRSKLFVHKEEREYSS